MSNNVLMAARPQCDICGKPAHYDARLPGRGTWAYLCERHFVMYGCRLGTGHGQQILVKEKSDGDKNL